MSAGSTTNMRAWSWVRVDGRNVVAIPAQQQIHLYDSDDFILLSTIAHTGHASAITKVRWSAFHAKLASLSSTQLIIHGPQVTDGDDDGKQRKVSFVPMWEFQLPHESARIHSFSFSRCAEQLLYSDSSGIGILDIHNHADAVSAMGASIPQAQVMWRSTGHGEVGNAIVKFSPSEFVFGSSNGGQNNLKVWRMAVDESDRKQVLHVDDLPHPDRIVYYSWKPANTQLHAARTLDGSHKARWFEPPRILLTCTVSRAVRIWTEADIGGEDATARKSPTPTFITVLVFEPRMPIDNFRWVLSKNRNISEEKFESATEKDRTQIDWVSGVDRQGILHLWRLVGIPTAAPTIEETGVCIKINDEESEHREGASSSVKIPQVAPLQEICVMAYFSQDYFGIPSAFDIILQRADNIILSYNVAVARKSLRPHIKRKSWYRSHTGAISALATHPSLPLIASVGAETAANGHTSYEVLIFWISFSAFSAESRLIPSGVLKCAEECGEILSVQWVPTLHFDATPLLLVAFASGTINVYGRAADAAGVVSSPTGRVSTSAHRLGRSPSVSPWTFYDYSTGESGAEYEVTSHKQTNAGVGFSFESKDGKLVVSEINSTRSSLDQVSLGDEFVGINNKSVIGKTPAGVGELIDAIPAEGMLLLRFRARSSAARLSTVTPISSSETSPLKLSSTTPSSPAFASAASDSNREPSDKSVDHRSPERQHSFLSTMGDSFKAYHEQSTVVHAGTVSMYGGWRQLLNVKAAASLALLCVSPVYADDGEYEPNTVLIFGITSLPGKLSAWKGVCPSSSKAYDVSALNIQNSTILRKHDITSIASERDYRQRAFSSKRLRDHNGLNSLLFLGDTSGSVQHWRCQLSGEDINFTLMSSCSIQAPPQSQTSERLSSDIDSFSRRGYVAYASPAGLEKGSASTFKRGIHHIEVDDPNRIAVLDVRQPDQLHIYEAESGLGILRLEESVRSAGRGDILGFCWCNAHVEFNVDVLAVHYTSGIVLYQHDMNLHRWVQIGEDIATPFSIFDCTRDSSALLIGGGFLKTNQQRGQLQNERGLTSNEMPGVLGKWDEPGSFLQYSMDWKAAESPQKLPVWHPYVIITTLFGMHARVGVKDTQLAGDQPTYEFSKAFKDAVQMLKLLAKVLDDNISAQLSARSGILSYAEARKGLEANGITSLGGIGRRDSVGRYSTAVHQNSQMNKAEHLFGGPPESEDVYEAAKSVDTSKASNEPLSKTEAAAILDCIDALLCKTERLHRKNGALMFASFDPENLLEMKAVLHYVDAIQSLGFELDASAADLGAKRYFSSCMFAKSLKEVVNGDKLRSESIQREPDMEQRAEEDHDERMVPMCLDESPSSGILWALHSDAQQFLLENCVHPQATWDDLRSMWLGLWMKNTRDLRGVIERLAKSTFARTKDAIDVCLYYIALGKKNVLGALAKLSKTDQNKKLSLFLDHDFSQERWCNAAVKNAYSLLSKKQYETAAAFFLICEPPRLQEALRVLAVRMSDPSLALVISRLVEYRVSDKFQQDFISSASPNDITEVGAITRTLLDQDIVPYFRQRKDRWMESCALWWLEDFEQACTVLLPLSQAVDAADIDTAHPERQHDLPIRCKAAVHFYVNLTSSPIYFQYLHSSINSTLISWANKKRRQAFAQGNPTDALSAKAGSKLASTADIEHAYSFAAYACKRNGLSDTALVEMLQARHLVNVHARFEIAAAESDNGTVPNSSESQPEDVSLPRVRSSMRNMSRVDLQLKIPQDHVPWSSSPRRMSDMHRLELSPGKSVMSDKRHLLHKSKTVNLSQLLHPEKTIPPAPWLKAQIADIECRRWSSSAFVGKMIGIRVAREMISHFRAELDLCFQHFDPTVKHFRAEPHQAFLEELCAPLCKQFQVDRNYVLEAALGVMQPHAYLHIVEVCFLLSELERSATLCKWVQYVSLSMLHSCSTFASCKITGDIYRDWEGLTIQLCYILNLDAQGQLQLPNSVVAQVAVAVRTGCIFLSWCRHQSKIIHEAILAPFFVSTRDRAGRSDDEYFAELSMFSFETTLSMVRQLQQDWDADSRNIWNFAGTFGYTFLETVASYLQGQHVGERPSAATREKVKSHWLKLRKMYSLILLVSILRTHYARAQVFLMDFHDTEEARQDLEELDISSSLFTPRKMWKVLEDGPLDGIKRWYSLMESHLRCEFDYSVKEVTCLCGLYGLDGSALKLAEQAIQRVDSDQDHDKTQAHQATHSHHLHHHHSQKIHNAEERYDFQSFLHEIGISNDIHSELVKKSDDYILLLMQHPHLGVMPSFQRFRVDPRVHVKCFSLKDAFDWFSTSKIYSSAEECQTFLSRCCKNRKLRLLVQMPGEDCHMFPMHHDEPQQPGSVHEKRLHHVETETNGISETLHNQAMMFVDPWEVEAADNTLRYIHKMNAPRHIELGWDRLSPICTETCDDIIGSVFGDPELVEMWTSTCGEGWLVTSITQYQLDGGYTHRTGHVGTHCVVEEEQKVPFLVEIHSRSQRNAMFREVGLPHRFVGVLSSDPYVFLELAHDDKHGAAAETWDIRTCRSRVGVGGVNPRWGEAEDKFSFRFAIPTHHIHTLSDANKSAQGGVENAWSSTVTEESKNAARGLESLFQAMYTGPPIMLNCSVFHKNKLFPHHFMGKGKVPLNQLTSGNPIDRWVPLEEVPNGMLHMRLSLSFQLMCSSVAGVQEIDDISLRLKLNGKDLDVAKANQTILQDGLGDKECMPTTTAASRNKHLHHEHRRLEMELVGAQATEISASLGDNNIHFLLNLLAWVTRRNAAEMQRTVSGFVSVTTCREIGACTHVKVHERESILFVSAIGTSHAVSPSSAAVVSPGPTAHISYTSAHIHTAYAPVIDWQLFGEDPQLDRRLFQKHIPLEPRAIAREAQDCAASTMKRHREESDDDDDAAASGSGDRAAPLAAFSLTRDNGGNPSSDAKERADDSEGGEHGGDEEGAGSSDRVELQCLTDNPDVVKQVKKLNLGVLPVQCPEFCYKRAVRDSYRLSWAAAARRRTRNTDADITGTAIAGGIIAEYEALNHVVHIRTLAVEPRFRRQGIGRRLIHQVIYQVRKHLMQQEALRVDSIRLHVHVGNDDGIAFYTQLGFAEEARLENYYRHLEPRACLVLSYALSPPAAAVEVQESE